MKMRWKHWVRITEDELSYAHKIHPHGWTYTEQHSGKVWVERWFHIKYFNKLNKLFYTL